MATSQREVIQFLQNRNWKYESDRASNTVITGVRTTYIQHLLIFIRIKENGEYIQFLAPQLCHLKNNVFKGVAYQTLLHISYGEPLIRFATDPTDGEICASIELPLEDVNLTQKLFDRCLDELIHIIDMETMPRLNSVLSTGHDKGKVNPIEYLYKATMGDRYSINYDFRGNAEALLIRATTEDLEWLAGQVQQRR